MSLSVQPLVIDYSFVMNRKQATDRVDLAQLDAALMLVTNKLNEIIMALNETTDDDNTLKDDSIAARNFSDDALEQITSIVREELAE